MVPEKTIFLDSRMFSCVHSSLRSFGSDSPVRDEWSTLSVFSSMSLASAGTLSPSSRKMISPGKTLSAGIVWRTPSLSASIVSGIILRKLSIIRSDSYSCMKAKTALMTTTPAMAMPIYRLPMPGESLSEAKARRAPVQRSMAKKLKRCLPKRL